MVCNDRQHATGPTAHMQAPPSAQERIEELKGDEAGVERTQVLPVPRGEWHGCSRQSPVCSCRQPCCRPPTLVSRPIVIILQNCTMRTCSCPPTIRSTGVPRPCSQINSTLHYVLISRVFAPWRLCAKTISTLHHVLNFFHHVILRLISSQWFFKQI